MTQLAYQTHFALAKLIRKLHASPRVRARIFFRSLGRWQMTTVELSNEFIVLSKN